MINALRGLGSSAVRLMKWMTTGGPLGRNGLVRSAAAAARAASKGGILHRIFMPVVGAFLKNPVYSLGLVYAGKLGVQLVRWIWRKTLAGVSKVKSVAKQAKGLAKDVASIAMPIG